MSVTDSGRSEGSNLKHSDGGQVHPLARIWACQQDADRVRGTKNDGLHYVEWEIGEERELSVPYGSDNKVRVQSVRAYDSTMEAVVFVDDVAEVRTFEKLALGVAAGGWTGYLWEGEA